MGGFTTAWIWYKLKIQSKVVEVSWFGAYFLSWNLPKERGLKVTNLNTKVSKSKHLIKLFPLNKI